LSAWFEFYAPAKVNLRLAVLGRRRDGYHELATSMIALDLCDLVRARTRSGGSLTLSVSGPAASGDVPTDGRNLVWRAAVATIDRLAEVGSSDVDAGIELELVKRIPSRAGLGGGSSDAAAAVMAVSAALGGELAPSDRRAILAELGSDTVFFDAAAHTGHAWCLGRGERVVPIETSRPDFHFVLLVPEVGVSTGAVYARLGLEACESAAHVGRIDDLLAGSIDHARGQLFNGLESAACEAEPELAGWRALLDSQGLGHYRLSGSGSTWFGLYADREQAERDLERLLDGARERGLGVRLASIARASGHGVVAARSGREAAGGARGEQR
jgi:4-diphosphocytidyl-2-C-methyl-D-erythritol kinase